MPPTPPPPTPPPPPPPLPNPPPPVPDFNWKTEYLLVWNLSDYRKVAGLTAGCVSYNFTTIANDVHRYFKDYDDYLKGVEELKSVHPKVNVYGTTKGGGKPWHASAHIGFWDVDPFPNYSGPLYQYDNKIR